MGQVFVLSNYILKYSRDERVRYISHLDFIRMFHRAVRRAELDMTFSKGFNPHPVMTVAMPLSVGITSDCEYMKIGFDGDYSEKELTDKINASLPSGYKIVAAAKTEGKQHDFSKLDRAVYTVEAECNTDAFDEKRFLESKELIVMKKTKSGEKEADIRPYIYDFSVRNVSERKCVIKMCIAAGNTYNLKPDTVIDAMQKYSEGLAVDFFCVHRDKLLAGGAELL